MTAEIEVLAALLLIANVWLVARRSIWNYGFGIAAVSLYAVLFLDSRLYAALGLQMLFLTLNLYGLVNWRRALAETGDVPVGRMSGPARLVTALVVAALALLIAALLDRFTDARSPLWDSANTALALAAQYWQARRRIETWPLWIAVNLGSAGLYASQGLWITSLTYALLLGIAIHGWRAWEGASMQAGRC